MEINQLMNEPDPLVEPVVEISVSTTSVCINEEIEFYAAISDADSIVWDFGDGSESYEETPLHAFSENGHYSVSATVRNSGNGKISSDTIEGGITIHPEHQNTASMEIAETDLPYQFGTQTLTEKGEYTEIFQSVNHCDSIVTLNLNVIQTGINDLAQGKDHINIILDPLHPANIWVQLGTPGHAEITVFNLAGVELVRKSGYIGNHAQLDLSMYQEGLYLMRIKSVDNQLTKKIILKKN
jgi:hypothetical protein